MKENEKGEDKKCFLLFSLESILKPKHPLFVLSRKMDWNMLMVGLLISPGRKRCGTMKDGNTKINMKTKNFKTQNSGYNPKIQMTTNSFSAKFFYDNSVVKNTTAELLKNRSIIVNNEISNR